jgi:hypothetical protein
VIASRPTRIGDRAQQSPQSVTQDGERHCGILPK